MHSLFIVTYGADIVWTKYCLASARKFLRGADEIVLAFPTRDEEFQEVCREYGAAPHPFEHHDPGHMQQQVIKLTADLRCREQTEWITFLDADCFFTEPTYLRNQLFVNDRPIWCYDTWAADSSFQWREGTEQALCRKVNWNFMRRHGMTVQPKHLKSFRSFMEQTHFLTLEEYIMESWDPKSEWFPARAGGKMWQPFGKPSFSEFCTLGAFLFDSYPYDFCWWRVDDFGWPGGSRESFCRQYWSHQDVTPEIQAEMEEKLNS